MPDFDVFLSYHWRDHAQVEALGQRLRGAGVRVFLDRWYLAPGTNWLKALETTLANCKAVAVCIGAEMGAWQLREQYSALEHQVAAERSGALFPVIPVLLPGSEPPLGFLRQNTWVDLRQQFDDPVRFAILTRAIRGEPPGPDVEPAVQQELAQVCPYRGLLYFREEDAEFLFGREAATQQLAAAVGQHGLVALVGASGSGKSSVVRAGLIPALRKSKSPVWEIVTIVPGDRPLHALAAALVPMLEPEMTEVTRLGEIRRLAEQLAEDKIALRDVIERVLAKQPGTERFMLVVDQWEELFTLTQDEAARRRFIDSILETTARAQLSVVLTLRGDFFGRAVTAYRPLSDRLQGAQVNLGPMNEAELRRAIEKPAGKVGLSFEPGLVDTILADAGDEPGNLPLLEFVLQQLWEQRQGGVMHMQAYDAMGRLAGAIAQKADALYAKLSVAEQQALQRVFTRLVHPGEGEHDTRRRAGAAEFDTGAAALIKKLSDERLLVTSQSATGDAETVELAHEALIRNWQLLRGWVDADRQFIAWHQDLSRAATKWRDSKRSADLLLRGFPLAQAQDWQKKKPEALSELEREFVAASAQRRSRMRWAAAGVAALVLATIGYAFVQAVSERQRANFARERAEELVQFMVFDLRDKLQPLGRLDLMDGVTARVNAYYDKIGATGGSLEVERRRGVNLHSQGDVAFAQGNLEKAREAYDQGSAIAERLAKADPTNSGWQRDLSVSYEKLGDVEVAAGQLDAARKAYDQSLAIAERLSKADPTNSEWQRDLSVSYNKLGDVEVAAGQLDAARKAYEQGLAIAERLAKADPTNSGWQRDLSVSYDKLGDVEVAAGQLDAARKAYEQGLAIAERLAKADPTNSGWQRDLSVSYDKLGDVEVAAGQLDAARKAYDQSLAIREHLAKADPTNSGWQRDLSVSYEKLGDVEVAAGQLDAARKAYDQGLAIRERLAKADPTNSGWQRDLSVSYNKLGDVEVAAGQLDAARKAYDQGLAIAERLAKADPTNSGWQRDLSVSYEKLGDVEVAAGKLDAARKAYDQSLAIRERLAKADPTNSGWQRTLSVSYNKLGDVEVAAGQLDAARKAYEQSLAIAERLAKADPTNSGWQRDLSVSYMRIGDILAQQNQRAEALQYFDKARAISALLGKLDPSNAVWKSDLQWLQARISQLRERQAR